MMIKNAIKNLGRNKGRTFLVGIVSAIVMLTSACSMVVHLSAKQLANKQMEQIGAQVIITRNDDKLVDSANIAGYQDISAKQMLSFSKSSLLKSSAIYGSVVGKTSLSTVEGSGIGSGMVPDGSSGDSSNIINFEDSNFESPNIFLVGSTNPKINDDFASGLRKIKEGSIYQKPGEVLISEELAKKNNLKVGDSFDVKLLDLGSNGQVPELSLKISGIYEDHKPIGDGDAGNLNKSNEVFMNYETFQSLKAVDATTGGISVEGSFQLKNPDDVKSLEQEFHKKGMPDYFELSVNRNAYEKSVAPIIQVADMARLFSIVILVVGALIMVALSLLSIRERKYEIGVLRAMGVKKSKICFMLLVEMGVLCIGCSIIALVVAGAGAQNVADMMLSGIKPAETIQFGALFVGNGGASVVTKIPAMLSVEAIIMILGSATGLALLGSASGIWYITKNEPMKILAERN